MCVYAFVSLCVFVCVRLCVCLCVCVSFPFFPLSFPFLSFPFFTIRSHVLLQPREFGAFLRQTHALQKFEPYERNAPKAFLVRYTPPNRLQKKRPYVRRSSACSATKRTSAKFGEVRHPPRRTCLPRSRRSRFGE